MALMVIFLHSCVLELFLSLFVNEQEKFEAAIERYRSEKRKLQRQCQKLEEELKHKENELTRTLAATEQLQGAFANFQKIGTALK